MHTNAHYTQMAKIINFFLIMAPIKQSRNKTNNLYERYIHLSLLLV